MICPREPDGELLASFPDGGSAQYYHFDDLGSTVMLSDGSGNPASEYAYGAWGFVLNSPAITQPYQYVGQLGYYTHSSSQGAEVSNWLELGVRFYNPTLGRFERVDPIHASINPYAYVDGSPLSLTDPEGLTFRSNLRFFWDWALGRGDNSRFYGPKTTETKEMERSPGVDAIRRRFYKRGCKSNNRLGYPTLQAYEQTALNPAEWSNTALQVGGFAGATAVNNGNGTVTFTVTNIAGAHSFFLHVVPNRKSKTGPMRNIKQVFRWTERIEKGRCPCSHTK